MDSQIRIFVNDIHEYLSHIQRDSKFLLTLADECLFSRFASLHLATYKFPQKATCLVSWALADQKLILIPN